MMKRVFALFLLLFVMSCGDDDNNGVEIQPPRLLADQAPEDDAAIQEYLATHFFELIDDGVGGQKVSIDSISGENSGRTPMLDFAESTVINVSSSQIGLSQEENDIPHTLYFVSAREGSNDGITPTIADSTLLRYEGSLLDGTKFDGSTSFTWQELPNFLRGYANGIARIASGTNLVQNNDGTAFYRDSGIGIIIMPSGLGYFLNSPSATIPSYSPLVFAVEVGNVIPNTDTDNDGIPSIMEDLDGNGFLFDDNTDLDSERNAGVLPLSDFRDSDDDDDGIPTRDEIEIDENGNITFPDSDGDGTPDYRDPDS